MSDPSPLLRAFDFQVQWCREPAPFTARVLRRSRLWLQTDAAAHAAFAAFSAADPLADAMALRWAGALHHLALRGLQPWAGLWPPAAPVLPAEADAAALDAALDAAVRAAWTGHRAHCEAALSLPPQTNEVLRSAVLLPGLLHIAARTGLPLALLEIGSSAGLNLWCERWHHVYTGADGAPAWSFGDAHTALTLRSEWRGADFAEAGADFRISLRMASRAGCDACPVDLTRPAEGLRLESFIWPEQALRLARLHAARQQAAQWMAESGVAVQAASALDFVQRELARPADGHTRVLMHSVVWQYIAPAERQALQQAIETAGAQATAQAPLAWLRLEPPQPDAGVELRCRLWPGGDDRLLARAHPHGTWIAWEG